MYAGEREGVGCTREGVGCLPPTHTCATTTTWPPDTRTCTHTLFHAAGGFNPQFFPQLEGIAALFGRTGVAASWLVHVMVINLFAGAWCLRQGGSECVWGLRGAG